jgi:hypothetical protein
MIDNLEKVSFPYPHDNLMDDQGYPTEAALEYIKNWQFIYIKAEATKVGHLVSDYRALIDYIKEIWTYDDAIHEQDGLLEIHTLGWSGNEEIIEELKKTVFWMMRLQAMQTGGHYYFKVDDNPKYTYSVEKVENKWLVS